MGGGRQVPSPPASAKDDPTLYWPSSTGGTAPPDGSGKACYAVPNLAVGTVLNPNFLGCDPGWYCPNLDPADPATIPVYCPPSPGCAIYRLAALPCSAQGTYEPIVCKPGYYCPNYKTMLKCPAGYFCPTGTVKPHKCGLLTMCPTGTVTQLPYGPLVLMVILDGLLAVILLSLKIRQGLLKQFNPSELLGRLFNGASWTLAERARAQIADHDRAVKAEAARMSTMTTSIHPNQNPNQLPDGAESVRVPFHPPPTVPTANPEDLKRLVSAFTAAFGHRELRMNFKFDNLALSLKNGKKVLEGVTGEIKSKRMTAIIGPSGAGKTTFMNVLMGKVPRTGGRLYINGAEAEMHLYRQIIGYVPQEDIMLRELTVREVVLHSARVRLPGKWTTRQVEDHVDNVLKALNLSHVANSFIGDETTRGVSGGQRKRVNIGMELAAAPLAIFLDEPTSGLDATAALEVADILQNIAHLGLTIVSVIHQPRIEIFRKFDDVLMIAPGGKVAYLGPIPQAQRYFESLGFDFDPGVNMSDVLMDILSGKASNNRYAFGPQELVAAWENRKVRDYFLEAPLGAPADDMDSMAESGSIRGGVMRSSTIPHEMHQQDPQMYDQASFPRRKRSIENVDRWLVDVDELDEDLIETIDDPSTLLAHSSRLSLDEQDIDHPPNLPMFPSQAAEFGTLGSRSARNMAYGPQQNSSSSLATVEQQQLNHHHHIPHDHHDSMQSPISPSGVPSLSHRGSVQPTMKQHRDSNMFLSVPGQHNGHGSNFDGASDGGSFRHPRRVHSSHTLAPSIVESLRCGIAGGAGSTSGQVDEEQARMDYEFHRLVPQVVKERGASMLRQMWYCHTRSLTQQSRATGALVLEIFVAMFAGVLMGVSTNGKVKELYSGIYISPYTFMSPAPLDLLSLYGLLLGIGIALAGAPSGVKVFGEEKPVFWREAASGHSKVAYYLGKTVATVYRLFLTSLHFTGMYAFLAKPLVDVYTQYLLIFLQFWGVYGMSCIISLVVRRENASLLSVVVGLFAAVFNGYGPNLTQAKKWGILFIFELSFNKWASEAAYATGILPYKHVYDLEQSLVLWGYSLDQLTMDFVMCFLLGVASRCAGFVLLIFLHRDKQR